MSSTIFARGSRCSCFSPAGRLVLQLRCPKLSPLLLLGFWSLFYVICNILSTLVCFDARLFQSPAPAACIGKAAILSVSGDSDAPLGSWAATELTTLPPDGYPAASLQQLRQGEGEVRTYKADGDNEKDARRAKAQKGGEGRERGYSPSEFVPTSLQQLGIFHDDTAHSRTQKQHEQQQGQLQEKMSLWQRQGSLSHQQLPQQHANHRLVSLQQQHQQKTLPQQQKENSHFQKVLGIFTVAQGDPASRNAAYIQSVGKAAAKQEQQRHEQEGERLLQQRKGRSAKYHNESFLAYLNNGNGMHGHVVSRHSTANIRPILLSGAKEDGGSVDSKQVRRRSALVQTQASYNKNVEHSRRALLVPGYHRTTISINSEKTHDKTPASVKGGGGGILLETRGETTGIGTILAGAGLSTLLGGLSQYQQGPLAAGPPASTVPALAGAPATAALAPAAAVPGVPPVGVMPSPAVAAAAVPGAVPAAEMNPMAVAGMGTPTESSGHNVLPITVGIILGLLLMCLIGGCIFRKMKKKRRR